MPHSLLELNAMSEEQLRALGENLSIKNAKKLDMETLGFAILDEEARIESQKPIEEKPRKRGRPTKKKEEKPKQEAPAKPEAPAQEESRTPREVDYSAIYSLFKNKNNDNLPS